MSDKAMYGYVAGIIDGEGTITIGRNEYTNTKTGKYRHGQAYHGVHYASVISVKNTDERLMKWLKSRFGGEYYTEKRTNETWKDSYKWYHCAKDKESFLLSILPYLVIKREQAKILLEFLRIEKWLKIPTKRQELYEKIVALNQRGKPVETNTQDTFCKCGHPELHQTFVCPKVMIESVLISDDKSTPTVTLAV